MHSNRLLVIEDRIFTEERIKFYGRGVIAAYAVALAWRFAHGEWIFLPEGRLRCVDFGWMWLSGNFANSAAPMKIYDYAAFSAAQLALFGHGNCLFFPKFDYPPTSLFFTYSLGWMPYTLAFAVWIIATFLAYEATVYAVIPKRTAIISAVIPFCVPVNVDFGHNGFLTAALIGSALACLERRPWISGIFLALLTYKPHFGVLFPLALLVSRAWRALLSAAMSTAVLSVAAAIAFGSQGWLSFFHALIDRKYTLSPVAEVPLALHSVFGLLRWTEASPQVCWPGHLAVAAVIAIVLCLVWARPITFPLKAAFLCIGSVMTSPYILFYDLCILSIAAAFLVRDGISRGFLPGERTVLLGCITAMFLVQVPVGPVISSALAILTFRRIIAHCRVTRNLFPSATTTLGPNAVAAN